MTNVMEENVKITVVGDVVGKTTLLRSYLNNTYCPDYIPTVCENYISTITVDAIKYNMILIDTNGFDEYYRLRAFCYQNTNCFMICFSVNPASKSYYNVIDKWVPEVRNYSSHTPIILVATQIDLREDPTRECFTVEDGEELKNKVKVHGYVECSAKTGEGLDQVFIEAVCVYKNTPTKALKSDNCVLF